MQQTAQLDGLPDLIHLGSMTICIPTNEEGVADQYFNQIVNRIKHDFYKKRPRLALLYDLDIELEAIYEGSRKYKTKQKLRLKKRWRTLKKAWVFSGALLAAVAGYPAVKDGAIEIYNDLQTVTEHVLQDEQQKNPSMPPTLEDCIPPDDNGNSGYTHLA